MDARTIFFIGKPGSGKDTQAALLSRETGWPVVAASNEIRALAQAGTSIGKKIKATIESGDLTPAWMPGYLFIKTLFSTKSDDSLIFTGFNRRVIETELVIDSLTWLERPFTVFHLHTSDEEVRKRLALRKEKEGRADDHDHIVDKRFEEYYKNTEPTIALFKKAGVLIEVDGEQTPEKIAQDIRQALQRS